MYRAFFLQAIYDECQDKHNFKLREAKCKSCCSTLRQAVLSHECKHKNAGGNFMGACYSCFRLIEKSIKCSHMKSINKRKLEASGYSFILLDNYTEQIVYEKAYFQTSGKHDDPVKHFMNLLREEMVPFLTDKIIPKKPMRITEEEERSFKSKTSCYTCGKKFRDIPGPDNKVRDHCHVLGMRFEIILLFIMIP